MLSGHQRIKWHRNIAENFNQLSRVHERYRQMTDDRQTDRQTDARRHITNMNISSRSLKIKSKIIIFGTETIFNGNFSTTKNFHEEYNNK